MGPTNTPRPAIIRPFRWWKTCGLFAAIIFGAILPGLIVAVVRPDKVPDLQQIIAQPLGFVFVFAGSLVMSMTAALMLCVAQIYALKGYYQRGQIRAYRSRLYASSLLQFFLFALMAASGGMLILSPIGVTIWATYYVKNRRRVLTEIRKIEAEQSGPVDQPRNPSRRLRNHINALNGWQRAWIVTGFMLAAVVLLFATITAPETPTHLKEQQKALAFSPENHEVPISLDNLKAGDRVYISDSQRFEELSQKIKNYPHDLALHVVESAAVWAFTLITIYLLGMGVAWVRTGFRPRRPAAPQN
jgi:hypothetical protein